MRGIVSVLLVALMGVSSVQVVNAASSYANPAFEAQWRVGEALAPNFWGPLSTAKDGQQEPYRESMGGMRFVQYFEKGRMELATGGRVTNGLLANEIVTGQIQVGDSTFEAKPPPAIPMAGDADNPGPTYAQLSNRAAALLSATPNQTDTRISRGVTASGDITTGNTPNSPGTTLTEYDSPTQHNVTLAFSQYRNRAGVATIGLAISEPFFATVRVGGQMKDVVIQVFERRVLTYTATNPEAFQVEMGNIGQHYFQWRYETMSAPPVVPQQPVTSGTTVGVSGGTFRVTLPPGWRESNSSTSLNVTLIGPTAMHMTNLLSIRNSPTDLTVLPNDPVALLGTSPGSVVLGNNGTVIGSSKVVIGDGATLTTPVDVMIGGEQGKQFTFTVQTNSTTIFGTTYVALHNGRAYIFLGTSSDANHAGLDAIVGSLVFTDGPRP